MKRTTVERKNSSPTDTQQQQTVTLWTKVTGQLSSDRHIRPGFEEGDDQGPVCHLTICICAFWASLYLLLCTWLPLPLPSSQTLTSGLCPAWRSLASAQLLLVLMQGQGFCSPVRCWHRHKSKTFSQFAVFLPWMLSGLKENYTVNNQQQWKHKSINQVKLMKISSCFSHVQKLNTNDLKGYDHNKSKVSPKLE